MENKVEVIKWEMENESVLRELNLIAVVFGVISSIIYKYLWPCEWLWIPKCKYELSETGYHQNVCFQQ